MIEFRARNKRARLHDPRGDFARAEIESEVGHCALAGDLAEEVAAGLRARFRPA